MVIPYIDVLESHWDALGEEPVTRLYPINVGLAVPEDGCPWVSSPRCGGETRFSCLGMSKGGHGQREGGVQMKEVVIQGRWYLSWRW